MENNVSFKNHILSELYVIFIIVICITPFLLSFVKPDDNTSENRKPAEFPALFDENGMFNYNYLNGLGAYFDDRFALRSAYVSLDSNIKSKVFATSPDDSVIVGKNGWLYYSATLDDYMKKDLASSRKLYNIARNIKLIQNRSERNGAAFVFAIAPNKNTLYPEYMPERYVRDHGKKSDLEALYPYLDNAGVNYVNLSELFSKQDEILYFKRDSHWSKKGAVLVYNAMLDSAGKGHETYANVDTTEVYDYVGDLNKMLYPLFPTPERDTVYDRDYTWEYANDADDVTDNYILTKSKNGSGNLLMYRDSFGNSMIDLFAEEFENACFSKNEPYNLRDLNDISADTFILEKVERHLSSLAEVAPLMEADRLQDVTEYYVNLANREFGIEMHSLDASASGVPELSTESEFDIMPDILPVDADNSGNEYADTNVSAENGYVKISGHVFSDNAADDMRIFAELSHDDNISIYEAFCISDKESDYGYTLYFSPETLLFSEDDMTNLMQHNESKADDLGVRIFILQNGEYKSVYENDIIDNDLNSLNEQCEQIKADIQATLKKQEEEAKKTAEAEKKRLEEEKKRLEEEETDNEEPDADEKLDEDDKNDNKATQEKSDDNKQQEKPAENNNSGIYEVSRVYYEDCGADTGYWEITWSDGSVTYVDD